MYVYHADYCYFRIRVWINILDCDSECIVDEWIDGYRAIFAVIRLVAVSVSVSLKSQNAVG